LRTADFFTYEQCSVSSEEAMRDRSFVGFVIGTVVVAVVLGLVQMVFRKGQKRTRTWREFLTDATYWGFTPFGTRFVTRSLVGIFVVALALALGFGRGIEGAQNMLAAVRGYSPIAHLPVGVQLVLALVMGDFIGYWQHRLFHRGRLWRFHAVHHSSKTLDWLAATRIHPINDLIGKLAITAPLAFAGFDIKVLAGVAPLLTLHALFIHADVPWSFGPLKYVISSPCFHRWHHTSEAEGLDKNFAGLLPVWDLVFGTFFMPDRIPVRFGVDDQVPEGLWGQLIWPFRRHDATPQIAEARIAETRSDPGASSPA
jgi:sterol desaturase/sphingolipid hydroxylase (fatty acid hydroxylase superfamily)